MKWLNFIIIVLATTLVNAGSTMNLIAIGSLEIRPNLLVVALAFFAYILERRDAVIAAFMIGFMADISGATMGPSMLAFGIIGSSFSAMRDLLIMQRRRNRFVAISLMSVCIMIIIDILTFYKTGSQITKPLITIPLSSLYTALAGAFLWYVFDFISVIFGAKKRNTRN